LDSRRDTVDFSHEMFEKSDADESLTGNADIVAQLMIVCDKLSRCGWTEEEFIKMFTSVATV
jgi:Ca2+-binding EF-hand superfamily protein